MEEQEKLICINGECSHTRLPYHNHRPTWKFFPSREYTFYFFNQFLDHSFRIFLRKRHRLIAKQFCLMKYIHLNFYRLIDSLNKNSLSLNCNLVNDCNIFDGLKIYMQSDESLIFLLNLQIVKNKYNYIIINIKIKMYIIIISGISTSQT